MARCNGVEYHPELKVFYHLKKGNSSVFRVCFAAEEYLSEVFYRKSERYKQDLSLYIIDQTVRAVERYFQWGERSRFIHLHVPYPWSFSSGVIPVLELSGMQNLCFAFSE